MMPATWTWTWSWTRTNHVSRPRNRSHAQLILHFAVLAALAAAACSGGGVDARDAAETPGDARSDRADGDDGAEIPHDPARAVTALAVDPAGAELWIGTEEGAARVTLAGGAITRYRAADGGLPCDAVATVAVDDAGNAWFGHGHAVKGTGATVYCGLSRLVPSTGQWTTFTQEGDGLIDDRVFTLAVSPRGTVWAGAWLGAMPCTASGCGAWFDWHDCATPGAHCKPIWSYHVGDIAFAADGTMWLAIDLLVIGIQPKPGGVARRDTESRTDTWDMSDGLPTNQARRIAVDGEGRAWAGSPSGLATLDPGSDAWRTVMEVDALDLAVDGRQALWVATASGAVERLAGGATRTLTRADGLPSDEVRALAWFGASVCFGTAAGVACLDTADGAWTYPY